MQASLWAGLRLGFMPWTYPPQFDLLLAPLAFLPTWAAYALFTGTTLAAYLITLRKLAGEFFPQVLVILFPAVAITIGCGQNGLLTGALIRTRLRPCREAAEARGPRPRRHGHQAASRRRHRPLSAGDTAMGDDRRRSGGRARKLACVHRAFGPQIWLAWLVRSGSCELSGSAGSYRPCFA